MSKNIARTDHSSCPHKHAYALMSLSFRLSHSNTPPRDLTSSVSLLNYSSPSSCPSFLSLLVSHTSVLKDPETRLVSYSFLIVNTRKPVLQKSEQTNVPKMLLNVLMGLLVPSEPTTLGRGISFESPDRPSENRQGMSHNSAEQTFHCRQSDYNHLTACAPLKMYKSGLRISLQG